LIFARNFDKESLERMITGFRESELCIEGFETHAVRAGNQIDFMFVRESECDGYFTGATMFFDGQPVVWLLSDPIILEAGDTLKLHYILKWWYEGPGGVSLPSPVSGFGLVFEWVLVA